MKAELEADEVEGVPDRYAVEVHPLHWSGQTAARSLAVVRRAVDADSESA